MVNKSLPIHNKEDLLHFFAQFDNNSNIGMIFVGITVITSVFCVPISWLKALGGMYFGVEKGFIYALLAATISCSISFLLARILGREVITNLYEKFFKHKLNRKQQKYFEEKKSLSFTYIFLLRNIYFIPFSLINYFLGITYVSFKKYILASFLGMIPGTFIYTYFFAKSLSIQENPSELIGPILLVISYYALIYILKRKFEGKVDLVDKSLKTYK
ncbi:MAG: VTT domain-containing protein [Clostridiaceae bacterium]|nr:VTT domain-containing protein [Clostridiaceae bacterium]